MALLATHGVDEGLEAEAAGVEGLDGVPAEPLLLGAIPKLALLLIREEREVVVVLRVPLRHLFAPKQISSITTDDVVVSQR